MGIAVFDDLPWCKYLNLTTVAQPTFKLSEVAGKLLHEKINKRRKKPKEIVLDVELKIRKSAGEN